MPLLSTFGAGSATGGKPPYWESNTQFFAIGGGGAGKLDWINFSADTTAAASGSVTAVSYSGNSSGYPGVIASNTSFTPMVSGETLRYKSAGTNADGSGPALTIKSGERYSVVIGAGGISGSAGGTTSLIKNGTTVVSAAGGAASPGTQDKHETAVAGLRGPNGSYAQARRFAYDSMEYDPWWGGYYWVFHPEQVSWMASQYALGFRPQGSNASVSSAYQTIIRNDGNWDYYATNYFAANQSNLPHGPIMRATTGNPAVNGVDGQGFESITIPMLSDSSYKAGGILYEVSLSRPYWDLTQHNNNYPYHAYYGGFGNYSMGYSYPDYLFASTAGYNNGYLAGAGGGAGSGDPAGSTGSFTGLGPGGNGMFVLAYPASLPPLSSTTGIEYIAGLGITENPGIVTKNNINYRVYVWKNSGSFVV